MTVRRYSSISQETYLTTSLNTTATTMVVNSASVLGSITPASGERFTLVIDPDTALEEIVYAIYPSSPSSTTITIIRGVDGTGIEGVSGTAHSAGAKVRHMAIGVDFREANNHIENVTTAHGLTIANVLETTDTDMITTGMLQANSVTTAKITDLNVTTAKLADGAVTSAKIADLGIATGDIADSAITSGKIATGAVGTAKIDDLSVTEGKLAPNAVTTAKISDSNVTTAKIADLNVTTGKIADSAITSAKIADLTIATGDIADSAITSAKIADGTIVAGDIADGAITSAKILDGTIVDGDVSATAAIAKTKLNLGGTITSADLVDGTIVNADISPTAGIALSKLAVDPLARANHTGTQTASTVSDFDTQVRTSRLDQMAAPSAAVALNAQKITGLADPTNAQDAVTLNYITTQKGAANGLASLDGTGKLPTSQLPGIAVHTTFVVASQAAMLAVSGADEGDLAVRTDLNKTFILTAVPASTLGNWQELLTPTDSVTSVDGNTGAVSLTATYLAKTGGTMSGALAMGNNKITGLGTPTATGDAATKDYVDAVAGSATAAAASAAAAATTYDNFDDRYLGAKATAPTLDNDGNALITGAIYWNSSSNQMFAWTGSAWGSISSTADIYRFRYTATGGETSKSGLDDNGLTLSYIPGKEQVYLNGVLLARTSDYNATSGSSITGLSALTAGDILEIITFTAFELADAIARASFSAKGQILVGTGTGTFAVQSVGTNGQVLTANSAQADGVEWTTPTYVSTAGGSTIAVASGTTVPLTITNEGTGNSFVVQDSANPDTTPFVIDASGNVGIGTGSPSVALEVSAGTNQIISAKSSGTGFAGLKVDSSSTATQGYVFFAINGTEVARLTGNASNYLAFSTGSSATERMRIDNAGNVFLGTNTAAGQNTGGLTIQGKDIELMNIMGAY